MTTTTTGTFVLATLAVLVVPGPSVVFVVTRAVTHGRAAGIVSVLGLEVGLLVHVCLVAFGVGVVVTSAAWTLTALRTVGVAYLLFLGIRQLVAVPARRSTIVTGAAPGRRWAFARDAFVVDLLNPQTMLLLLALLPQFLPRGATATTGWSLFMLGCCVVALAFGCDCAWVVVCTSRLVKRSASTRLRWLDVGIRRAGLARGAVYVGLAAWSAAA